MPLTEQQYRSLLVDSKIVSEEEFKRALDESQKTDLPIEAVLVNFGTFKDNQIGKIIANEYGVKFTDLEKVDVDPEAIKAIPEIFAKKQGVLSFGWKNGVRQVAMVDPQNLELIEFIEKKTGEPVEVSYTTFGMIERAFSIYSENVADQIRGLGKEFAKLFTKQELSEAERDTQEEIIINITDLLLNYGYDNNASDIHVEPHEEYTLVRYRVDGILHDEFNLPKTMHDSIVSRIKIMAKLRTDEHYAAQDGKFRVRLENENVDIRVSILPIVEGEKIVMRLLAEKGREYSLETIGVVKSDLERVREAAKKPYGMLLATGPTGSGKTTTLYSVLKLLNKRDVNISTIEDPVEYDIEGINQIQVNPQTNLTFAAGLRSIVRQDPDIIMVGEIRDEETAGIAVNSAMTGHLVLSTLHTNNAATALPRLLDMDVEPFLIASSVNVIIAQRLVRQICKNCIASIEIDVQKLKKDIDAKIIDKQFGKKTKTHVFHGKGCSLCHYSGYVGRTGIFEVMSVSTHIRELIMTRANADKVQEAAVQEGMTTMIEDGIRKVIEGVTTIDEVLRVVK